MAIIAKNVTASGVRIPDLSGIFITASGQADLREFFSLDVIHTSEDLKDLINDDTIVLNDGVRDLTKIESLDHADVGTVYESVSIFPDLGDTPTTYSGFARRSVVVKEDESGLEFVTVSGLSYDSFSALEDTPTTYSGSARKYVAVNEGESGLEFVTVSGFGAVSFSELEDTPTTYSGSEGQYVKVKNDGTGLEFSDVSTGIERSGLETVASGVSQTSVTFDCPFSSSNYAVTLGLENITDASPSAYMMVISSRAPTGFTVSFFGDIDSPNYKLNWIARGISGEGIQPIANGASTVQVVFGTSFLTSDYTVTLGLENTTDPYPSAYAMIISSKTTSGFIVSFSGDMDYSNYKLNWLAEP